MDIAGLVVAGVSALGTLVQAFYAAKNSNSEVSKSVISRAEDRASKPLKVGTKVVDDVIDQDLLLTLCHEIETHNKALISAFTNPELSVSEKELLVESARAQICKFLSEVMDFNNGQLPTERLKKLWQSNRCRT